MSEKELSGEISITSDTKKTPKDVWIWGSGKQQPISDLDELSTAKAAIHCLKQIRFHSNRARFQEYKRDIAETENKLKKAKGKIEWHTNMMMLFTEKLELLSEHSINSYAIELPEDFQQMKELLSKLQPDYNSKKTVEKKVVEKETS